MNALGVLKQKKARGSFSANHFRAQSANLSEGPREQSLKSKKSSICLDSLPVPPGIAQAKTSVPLVLPLGFKGKLKTRMTRALL